MAPVFMTLREARKRGIPLAPIEQAAPDLPLPFPAGRFANESAGVLAYDERLWRFTPWRDTGRTPAPGGGTLQHKTRCLAPTPLAKRLMRRIGKRIRQGWTRMEVDFLRDGQLVGHSEWVDPKGKPRGAVQGLECCMIQALERAGVPLAALGDAAELAPAEQPIAPWFVWAMIFGIGGALVYTMLPPEPAPRRNPRRRRRTSRARRTSRTSRRRRRARRNPADIRLADRPDPSSMSREAIRAELDQLKSLTDQAYWLFTRSARGKPPSLQLPNAYRRVGLLKSELRRRRGPRPNAKRRRKGAA